MLKTCYQRVGRALWHKQRNGVRLGRNDTGWERGSRARFETEDYRVQFASQTPLDVQALARLSYLSGENAPGWLRSASRYGLGPEGIKPLLIVDVDKCRREKEALNLVQPL